MNKTTSGFTIVELLIVIVVIAVLAAISIVTYNGVQERAHMTKMKSDFAGIERAIDLYKAEEGRWPTCSGGEGSTCNLAADLAPQLTMTTTIPTHTGRNGATPIAYVVTNTANPPRWAVLFQRFDGTYCKVGRNVPAGWWTAYPMCW